MEPEVTLKLCLDCVNGNEARLIVVVWLLQRSLRLLPHWGKILDLGNWNVKIVRCAIGRVFVPGDCKLQLCANVKAIEPPTSDKAQCILPVVEPSF